MFTMVAAQLLLTTGVLAAALVVTGEEISRATLPKCLGVGATAVAVSYIPALGFLSVIVWFAALMIVFKKSLAEAVVIAIVCWVIVIGIGLGSSAIRAMFA